MIQCANKCKPVSQFWPTNQTRYTILKVAPTAFSSSFWLEDGTSFVGGEVGEICRSQASDRRIEQYLTPLGVSYSNMTALQLMIHVRFQIPEFRIASSQGFTPEVIASHHSLEICVRRSTTVPDIDGPLASQLFYQIIIASPRT